MPIGPPEDPNRFEDYDACVNAISEGDTTREEAREICGKWQNRVKNGIVPVTNLEQTDVSEVEAYEFYGIIQKPGVVSPANIDHEIYYTPVTVSQSPDVVGTDLRIDHMAFEDKEASRIGEVVAEARLDDHIFGKFQLQRDSWNSFVQYIEDHNGNIDLAFNELIQRVDAGELALSAGLSAKTATTPIHEHTVQEIRAWSEVSVVAKPASPGSWAWACEDSCDVIFKETMNSVLDVDLETLQQAAEEETGDELPSQIVEVLESDDSYGVQITPDGKVTVLQNEEDLAQSGCNCEDHSEELEQVRQERDKYKTIVEEFQQQKKESAADKLREVNQTLPEEEQYEDDELEQFIEESQTSHLEQTAEMLSKVASTTQAQQTNEEAEDLSGTSSPNRTQQEVEEAEKAVNQATRELLGRDADQVFEDVEAGRFGE